MGFLDSIKKATGIGLAPAEHYQRAFEKGILLGPAKFAEAVGLFETAAKKAADAGDSALQARALANAHLYRFISGKDFKPLAELCGLLSGLTEVEQIGSRTETMPAQALCDELAARIIETQLDALGADDHGARASAHIAAANAFKKIFSSQLVTYRYVSNDSHVDAAQARFFLHQGMAAWNQAADAILTNPETAAENMGKALAAFRQCRDEQWIGRSQSWLESCRIRRTCWMCHRESQGAGVHFKVYPAVVTPYVVALVMKLGQDATMLDLAHRQVVLCTTCGSAVEQQADYFATLRAKQVHDELTAALHSLEQRIVAAVQQLDNRLSSVERLSHHH